MHNRNAATDKLLLLLNGLRPAVFLYQISPTTVSQAMELIAQGADPNTKNLNGRSLLHFLAMSNVKKGEHDQTIKELVEKYKADINILDHSGFPPFHYFLNGTFTKESAMNFIKLGAHPYIKNSHGYTLLHILASYNYNQVNADAIQTLVNTFHDVDILDANGLTPLQYIISGNFDTDTAMLLIRLGADINRKNIFGHTLLKILSAPGNNIDGKNQDSINILLLYNLKKSISKVPLSPTDIEEVFRLELNLSNLTLDKEATEKLTDIQNINPRIISLKHTTLHATSKEKVIDSFKNTTRLIHFIFTDNSISSKDAKKLTQDCTCLQLLDLSSNNISDEIIDTMTTLLENNPSLRTINLSRNPFTKEGIEKLHQISISKPSISITATCPIGKGAFGNVYLEIRDNRLTAIKQIKISKSWPLEDCKEEANIMQKLTAAHVYNVVQFYSGKAIKFNYFHLVMEYVPGGTLETAIKSNVALQNDWNLKHKIILGVTTGVHYINANGIIHGDLKSGNILLNTNWEVKICDFGLSKKIESPNYYCGTFEFASPEALLGKKQTPQSDHYSLGMVMWEIVANNTRPYPFARKDNSDEKSIKQSIIEYVVKNNCREEIPSDCPPKFATLMCSFWQSDPKKRVTTGEVLPDLQAPLEEPLSEKLLLRLDILSSN